MENKVKNYQNWVAFENSNIWSDRSIQSGERLVSCLIDDSTEEIMEKIVYTADSEYNMYMWTKHFCDKINDASEVLKAGVTVTDTFIEVLASQYRNMLWSKVNSTTRAFATTCHLNHWLDNGEINSSSGLPAGMLLIVEVRSKGKQVLYEKLTYQVPPQHTGRYHWPFQLCCFVNEKALFARAGEKDEDTKLFKPLGSSYRNHFWSPNRSNLEITMSFDATEALHNDAVHVYANILAFVDKWSPPSQEKIDAWMRQFNNGKFNDIQYPDQNAGKNIDPLYEHLNRARSIAKFARRQTAGSNVDYTAVAIDILKVYADTNYMTHNWWERRIGLAKIVAESIILLADTPRSEKLFEVVKYLQGTSNVYPGMTGANQADLAFIQLLWSIGAWRNSHEASYLGHVFATSEAISALCRIMPRHDEKEIPSVGICKDYSYNEHNYQKYSQLYATSYGTVFLTNIFRFHAFLVGSFELQRSALLTIEHFLIKGMGWFGYAGYFDFHPSGRAISRGMNGNVLLKDWCQMLKESNPESPEILDELIRRAEGDETQNKYYLGNRAYWVNDYMSHFAKDFCLWVKNVSTRTVGTESGNGENLKGYYLGAGSCFISITGCEYKDSQCLWDWQRIPGTTVEQVPGFDFPLVEWGENAMGSNDFVGTVSNGTIGVSSMILDKRRVNGAKKTVFSLEDRAVFVGSSIDISNAQHTVVTSVNQSWLRGEVIIDRGGHRETLKRGDRIVSNEITEVIHDGFRYSFSGDQLVVVEAMEKTGSWYDINRDKSPDLITGDIFSIWIEHPRPGLGYYAYQITNELNDKFIDHTLVSYTDDAHIYTATDKASAVAIIFNIGKTFVSLSYLTIEAQTPIGFIASNPDENILYLTVADPTQKLKSADFDIQWGEHRFSKSLALPEHNDERGMSVTFKLTKEGGKCHAARIETMASG
ncbi:MAG TPA: polysaccharide lyase family 8 super-sandwich domain-containing protein [Pseudosphingobacterium sp.]|nr:polysaccharide lyase family 8 super-sandwich domain-containing protein [Pseudosphingobacterium sp.]